jgi:hypothetical protein
MSFSCFRSRHTDISKLDLLLWLSSLWVTALITLLELRLNDEIFEWYGLSKSKEFTYIMNITHTLFAYSLLTNVVALVAYLTRLTCLLKQVRINFIIYWLIITIVSSLFPAYSFLMGFSCLYLGSAFYLYKTNTRYNSYISMRRNHGRV